MIHCNKDEASLKGTLDDISIEYSVITTSFYRLLKNVAEGAEREDIINYIVSLVALGVDEEIVSQEDDESTEITSISNISQLENLLKFITNQEGEDEND